MRSPGALPHNPGAEAVDAARAAVAEPNNAGMVARSKVRVWARTAFTADAVRNGNLAGRGGRFFRADVRSPQIIPTRPSTKELQRDSAVGTSAALPGDATGEVVVFTPPPDGEPGFTV